MALLQELDEELGLTDADITSLRPLCLVQHPSGVLDLGAQITTPLRDAAIRAAQAGARHQEYSRLLVVPAAALPGAVTAAGGTLVPPSACYFLDRLELGAQSSAHRGKTLSPEKLTHEDKISTVLD